MKKYKRVVFFEIEIESKTLEKNEKINMESNY